MTNITHRTEIADHNARHGHVTYKDRPADKIRASAYAEYKLRAAIISAKKPIEPPKPDLPPQLQVDIAKVMADKRWRTTSEIMEAAPVKRQSPALSTVRNHLNAMHRHGVLLSEFADGILIWKLKCRDRVGA